MPTGKTKFQNSWLEAEDCSKCKVDTWCRKGSGESKAFCVLCNKEVCCDNAGLEQVLQHAKGAKHRKLADGRASQV